MTFSGCVPTNPESRCSHFGQTVSHILTAHSQRSRTVQNIDTYCGNVWGSPIVTVDWCWLLANLLFLNILSSVSPSFIGFRNQVSVVCSVYQYHVSYSLQFSSFYFMSIFSRLKDILCTNYIQSLLYTECCNLTSFHTRRFQKQNVYCVGFGLKFHLSSLQSFPISAKKQRDNLLAVVE